MTTFICIEGPDNVGKSTQVELLAEKLKMLRQSTGPTIPSVLVQEVPTEGLTRRILYWMLRNGLARRLPTTFQMLQFVNRLLWQVFKLPTLKERYDYIILGRWSLSSTVYGLAEGVNPYLLRFMSWALLKPHKTFIISGERYVRESLDSYESDTELQNMVRDLYRFQPSSKNVIHVWNIGRSKDEVCYRIFSEIEAR